MLRHRRTGSCVRSPEVGDVRDVGVAQAGAAHDLLGQAHCGRQVEYSHATVHPALHTQMDRAALTGVLGCNAPQDCRAERRR
eukprot:6190826-Alexandrium_andersonii.AAC.1